MPLSLTFSETSLLQRCGEFTTAGLYFFSFLYALIAVRIVRENLSSERCWHPEWLVILAVNTTAGLFAWIFAAQVVDVVSLLGIGLVTSFIAHRVWGNFTLGGQLRLGLLIPGSLCSILWGVWFISTIPVSEGTRTLMYLALGAALVTTLALLPIGIVQVVAETVILCRRRWLRPRCPQPLGELRSTPKVSLHVPCYAEPPDVVITTLDALSAFGYPNFEVLVIDNNTKDPDLWRPVQEHCQRLGDRFRFFHVDPLEGAKAGALNFALAHTAEDAVLVGLLDADYVAEPDFLERLVGFFDDPSLGFVQTPHDYRDWQGSLYQRMCYWEYLPTYKLTIPAKNEWDAAYTVGTMCLIRKAALEEAGGWATWCLTEDSEVAVRIHALGYTGLFLTETFGRGLIPETFGEYKKQRFRWTAGPVQQFRKHYRMLLPWPFRLPTALSRAQRWFEAHHSGEVLPIALGLPLMPVAIAILVLLAVRGEVVPIPAVVWVCLGIGLPGVFIRLWLPYRLLGASIADVLGALVANRSLRFVRLYGHFAGALARRPLAWHRTSKFKAAPAGWRALSAARAETILMLSSLLLGLAFLPFATYRTPDLIFLGALGSILGSLSFAPAPMMAYLAERELQRAAEAPSLSAAAAVDLPPSSSDAC